MTELADRCFAVELALEQTWLTLIDTIQSIDKEKANALSSNYFLITFSLSRLRRLVAASAMRLVAVVAAC